MKKYILLFLLTFPVVTIFAQIKQGQFLAGGAISFESAKNEYATNPSFKSSRLFCSGGIGYFGLNKLAAGLRLDVKSYWGTQTHQVNASILPFLRYYVLPLQNKINLFADLSYVHDKSKWKQVGGDAYYQKAKGYHISAGPAIFLTPQIALEFTVGYRRTLSDNFDETVSTTFNTAFGIQIHPGALKRKNRKA